MAGPKSVSRWIIGAVSSVAAMLMTAGMAAAVFPPLYQTPTTPTTPVQVQTTPEVPVVITGDPGEVVTPVVTTPEPLSVVSGLIGLALVGGYMWRKQRKLRLQQS